MAAQPKWMTITGWIITGIVGLGLTFSGVMKFTGLPELTTEFVDRLGYPADLTVTIGLLELGCLIVYLVPQSAVLGAILLTGYLGGATATHVRIHDNFIWPVIGGVLVWLGIFFRDPRLRELLPLRRAPANKA